MSQTTPRRPGSDRLGAEPLSGAQRQALAQAAPRARKATGAARVAAFNGWCTAVFAALSAPFAPFSAIAAVMAIGLGAVAVNEFRGRRLIRQFDLRGPRWLGWNQLGFMGLLVGYCLAEMYRHLSGPSPYQAYLEQAPELTRLLGPADKLNQVLVLGVYGSIGVLSVVCQGLNALYYFSRARLLRAHLAQTPLWIVDLQRSGMAWG